MCSGAHAEERWRHNPASPIVRLLLLVTITNIIMGALQALFGGRQGRQTPPQALRMPWACCSSQSSSLASGLCCR